MASKLNYVTWQFQLYVRSSFGNEILHNQARTNNPASKQRSHISQSNESHKISNDLKRAEMVHV